MQKENSTRGLHYTFSEVLTLLAIKCFQHTKKQVKHASKNEKLLIKLRLCLFTVLRLLYDGNYANNTDRATY